MQMIVKCPTCGIDCRKYGEGSWREKGNECYKYILSHCEEHGDFTVSFPDVAPVVMPVKKKRRSGYYD